MEGSWLSLRSVTVLGSPEIIQLVEAAWCAGYACQDMDPSAERRPLFTPVVTPAKTPHPRLQQECHRYASRNEPSPSLSTLNPSAATNAPAASGDITTLILVDVSQHYSFSSLSFIRARSEKTLLVTTKADQFDIRLPSFHSRVCALLPGVTVLSGAFGSLRVPFHLVGDIVAF